MISSGFFKYRGRGRSRILFADQANGKGSHSTNISLISQTYYSQSLFFFYIIDTP